MADIFSICEFATPADTAAAALRAYLGAGMPANVRLGDVRDNVAEAAPEQDPQAGLLHVIAAHAPAEQLALAQALVEVVLQFGASWILLDGHNRTPGEIAHARGLAPLYEQFVQAGARSEIVLRKILEDSDDEGDAEASAEPGAEGNDARRAADLPPSKRARRAAPAETAPEASQSDFMQDSLRYDGSKLVTSQQDGVMMDWETPIMERSADLITREGGSVLNIGFGMGIIDTFIQARKPATHYICEAHPDVLRKMRADGWYDRPGVVVLEGPWKETLPQLLSQGTTLDGIYYDTFSEHYKDMLLLFDYVVGLLNFDGVFSFFNGLGADRQITYDVYKQVVQFDLTEFGLKVEYETLPVTVPETTWDGLKRSYYNLGEYALPKISFDT